MGYITNRLLILLLTMAPLAQAQPFKEIAFTAPITPIQPLLATDLSGDGTPELVILGVDEAGQRHLISYALNQQQNAFTQLFDLKLPAEIFSYALSEDPDQPLEGLFLQSHHQLLRVSAKGALKIVANTQGLLQQASTSSLAREPFVRDINGDGRLDLWVQDFNQLHLYLADDHNHWKHQTLPIAALMVAEYGRVSYSAASVFTTDANGDGRTDLIQAGDGYLLLFAQQEDGTFGDALQLPVRTDINGTDWWNKRDAQGQEFDQSQLDYRKLEQLKDINHDGWPDMIVRHTQSRGVLERTNDYEVYLGRALIDRVSYKNRPDSVIHAEGTLTGLDFVDINGDQRYEVKLSGFDIGLGQVIGALLSGSIDQDVYLYQLDEQDKFAAPAAQYKVDLTFSLSKGQSGDAVVHLADIDGDGLKDLLLSKDTRSLRIYRGQTGKTPFSRRAQSYKTRLPADGQLVQSADLNADGRADLMIRYGRLDPPAQQRSIKILLAQ